jgi:deoxyribodipyrimidine photo-lyase
MKRIPEIRIQELNEASAHPGGDYVLYWMTASRRVSWSFPLQRAVEWAVELSKPILVLEALRSGYRWASDRLHRFVIEGMADNQTSLAESPILYYPYVEPEENAGKGLLRMLGERAAVIVTDEFPCFMLPRMARAASEQVPVRMEAVDGNGLLPLRTAQGRVFPTAYAFRRFLQQELREHLAEPPKQRPWSGLDLPALKTIPAAVRRRWTPAKASVLRGSATSLASLPIDHSVPPAPVAGGARAAARALPRFVGRHLPRYGEDRNDVDDPVTSGLSPYLHFGHVSPHQVFHAVAKREGWTPDHLAEKADGKRSGWWGMSASAEAFLDQLITWRELGYNMAFHRPDYDRYESLPIWAQETLAEHEKDRRAHLYTLDQLEEARTHDQLWNAAQRQLATEGIIHNYLRMLWGKKILEWSRTPREALRTMIELNNKYALDGRDPNSYSGILWTLGRYDRPWGPERPIFGKIRYMSSQNTARKIRVEGYLNRYR